METAIVYLGEWGLYEDRYSTGVYVGVIWGSVHVAVHFSLITRIGALNLV